MKIGFFWAWQNGFLYCGSSNAVHFVKMVHNGIEYRMIQAYVEIFEIMEKSSFIWSIF
jgi:6-phosphogluconate dehydrogenase